MPLRIKKGSAPTSKGYIKITAGRWKGNKLHRLIAGWWRGRPLRKGEVVEHKDGDTSNFHPSNLRVMNKPAHDKLTGRRRRAGFFKGR